MKLQFVFSLIALFIFACGGSKNMTTDELALGKEKYKQFCMSCHGVDGKLAVNGAKDLTKSISKLKGKIKVINEGKGMMPPMKGLLTPEEIAAIAAYTIQLRKQSKK